MKYEQYFKNKPDINEHTRSDHKKKVLEFKFEATKSTIKLNEEEEKDVFQPT